MSRLLSHGRQFSTNYVSQISSRLQKDELGSNSQQGRQIRSLAGQWMVLALTIARLGAAGEDAEERPTTDVSILSIRGKSRSVLYL